MKRVSKAPPKENQTNQHQQASGANKECNSIKKLNCEPCSKETNKAKANSNQSIQAKPAERSFNQQLTGTKLQEIVEEVYTKTGIGYKIIEESDRPNKLKVLYQQTVHLLEEEIPKQLQRRNKLMPYQAIFVE